MWLPPKTFQCAHCGVVFEETSNTAATRIVEFGCETPETASGMRYIIGRITIYYHKCPICKKFTISGESSSGMEMPDFSFSYPPVATNNVPDCIPTQIRDDYLEACAIADLSPKASATLARRCLQGMIRDFWGITEKNLAKEISALEGKVPPDQWRVIDGIRRLGNIGAHMEADINTIVEIDADEAKKLLKLITLLFQEWYVQREERAALYRDIIEIDQEKQEQRKG